MKLKKILLQLRRNNSIFKIQDSTFNIAMPPSTEFALDFFPGWYIIR